MPKAPVHEKAETVFGEREIRATGQGEVPAPPTNTCRAHQCDESQFGRLVSLATDQSHQLWTPFWRQHALGALAHAPTFAGSGSALRACEGE